MTTDAEPVIDGRQFRNVLGQFCTGITVITTFDGEGGERAPIGFACQSFAALSLDPPLVLFCPTKESRSWAAIQRNGSFAVNMLAEEQQPVCARFGSREPDKFAGIDWHTSELDLPVLDGALATIQCTVDDVLMRRRSLHCDRPGSGPVGVHRLRQAAALLPGSVHGHRTGEDDARALARGPRTLPHHHHFGYLVVRRVPPEPWR